MAGLAVVDVGGIGVVALEPRTESVWTVDTSVVNGHACSCSLGRTSLDIVLAVILVVESVVQPVVITLAVLVLLLLVSCTEVRVEKATGTTSAYDRPAAAGQIVRCRMSSCR